MVTVISHTRTLIVRKNFAERTVFTRVVDRPFEARIQSQFFTFPFAY